LRFFETCFVEKNVDMKIDIVRGDITTLAVDAAVASLVKRKSLPDTICPRVLLSTPWAPFGPEVVVANQDC